MDLTGSPPPSTFHLSIQSSWLQTLWTGHGKAHNLKSLQLMFTFSVCGRRLLLICCLQIMILIVMKYAASCSEHSKHQMKGVLLVLSTWVFGIFLVLAPFAAVTAARVSGTVSTYFLRTSAQMLSGLLPLKPKAFPESTLDPSSSMRSRSGLSWSLHHCLCSSWIPRPQQVPAIVTRLFHLMANSTKTQTSEYTWIDYSLLLDSNPNFKHVILLSHGVTS